MTPQEKLTDSKYDGYMVSSNGRIFSKKRNKYLRLFIENGYWHVTMCIDGRRLNRSVHRIVAFAFCANPNNRKYVNHKDGNKLNNMADNLEWVTHRDNVIHAIENGLYMPPKNNRPDMSRPVIQSELNGVFVAEYPSANEAARVLGVSARWIGACANGGWYRKPGRWSLVNSSSGFVWKWKDGKSVKESIQKL